MTGSIRIKICGITDPDDAQAAVDAGADLIGLNFVPGSPRMLDLKTAVAISERDHTPRIIAEMKARSPSSGVIRTDFDPVTCAKAYFDGGAAAISVLTDKHYFGGELGTLEIVRRVIPLALLRKDFVVEAYQIDEDEAE